MCLVDHRRKARREKKWWPDWNKKYVDDYPFSECKDLAGEGRDPVPFPFLVPLTSKPLGLKLLPSLSFLLHSQLNAG